MTNIAAFLYLVSGVLFILALRGLSHPATSRKGNLYGMIGMAIAIGVTLLSLLGKGDLDPVTIVIILCGIAVGGIVGAMISEGVPEDEANFYAEGIRRGGSVVTAKVEGSKAEVAQSILSASRPVDYGSRRTSYQQQGWSRFDESAEPYTIEQIEAERQRYRRG